MNMITGAAMYYVYCSVNRTASFHWSEINSLSRLIDTINITDLPVLTFLKTNVDLRDWLVDQCQSSISLSHCFPIG